MGIAERRIREREARVELILKAALKTFARRGLKEATMEEIAKEAELGKGTIYYYFNSKEAILEELVRLIADHHSKSVLGKVRTGSTPLQIAETIIGEFVQMCEENPELPRLFCMVLAQPHGLEEALKLFSKSHRQWLKALEHQTQAALSRSGIPPKEFIDFVGSYVHGIFLIASARREGEVRGLKRKSTRALKALLSLKPQVQT